MILYYADTFYQMIICYLIKEKFHKEEKSVLAANSYIIERCLNSKRLYELFDEVYGLKYLPVQILDDDFIGSAEEDLSVLPYKMDDFEDKYIAAAHTWIGVYLAEKKQKFNLIEESCGILSKIEKLRSNVKLTSEQQDNLVEQMGLYDGTSEYIEHIYGSIKNNDEWLNNKKFVPISIQEELEQMPEAELKALLGVFTNEKISVDGNRDASVILTQHFANLGIMSWEEQKQIYSNLLDFFVGKESEVIIKPHPADIMPYEEIFDNVKVIKTIVPSEFLPYIFTQKPNKYLTVSSTAIDTIDTKNSEVIEFDFDYEKNYQVTASYYAALALCNKYVTAGYKMYQFMTFDKVMSNLCEYGVDLTRRKINVIEDVTTLEKRVSDDEKKIIFIDDVGDDFNEYYQNLNVNKNTILIFINSNRKYSFLNGNRNKSWENMLKAVLVYKQKNEFKLEVARLFIYSKENVDGMKNIKKPLVNEDTLLYTEMFDGEENKIKILEGIIKSTEKRLEFYIQREKELSELIENMK